MMENIFFLKGVENDGENIFFLKKGGIEIDGENTFRKRMYRK